MENIFIEVLPPWVETGLQPAFYDKESGTVLQQTARMYAKVIELIKSQNKVIEDFVKLYKYVHDYFENLDVQEEINNKLDEMAEDGTLSEIITAYLNAKSILAYSTISEMSEATNIIDGSFLAVYGLSELNDHVITFYKAREIRNTDVVDGINIVALSIEDLVAERMANPQLSVYDSVEAMTQSNLIAGQTVKTLGYYTPNDGGGATYTIRAKTVSDSEDGGSIIFIGDSLVAELQLINEVNVKQFGAKGDGTTDDREKIQAALDFINTLDDGGVVFVPSGTYMLSVTPYYKLDNTQRGIVSLLIKSNTTLRGEDGSIFTVESESWGTGAYYRMLSTHEENRGENIVIENITLDGNGANETDTKQASNIIINGIKNIKIHNVKSLNCNGNGIMVRGLTTDVCTNIEVSDCVVSGCTKIGIQCSHFKYLTIVNNQVSNTTDNGIDIYGNDADNHLITSSLFVVNNNIVDGALTGIFPETVEKGEVSGNTINNCTLGIRVNSINAQTNRVNLTANTINACATGISFVGPQSVNYALSNVIIGWTTTAIELSTTNRQVIRDNVFTPTEDHPIFTTAGNYCNHVSAMHNYIQTLGTGVSITTLINHGADAENGNIFRFEQVKDYLWNSGGSKVNNQYFQINIPTSNEWRGKFVVRIGNNQIAEVPAVYMNGTLQVGSKTNVFLAEGVSDDISQIRAYNNIRILVYTTSSTSISYQLQIEQEW